MHFLLLSTYLCPFCFYQNIHALFAFINTTNLYSILFILSSSLISLLLLLFFHEHFLQARHSFFTQKFNVIHRDVLVAHRARLLNVRCVQHSLQVTVVHWESAEFALSKVVSYHMSSFNQSVLSRSDTEWNKVQTFWTVVLIIWNWLSTKRAWWSWLWCFFVYWLHCHFLYFVNILFIYLS